MVIKLVEYPDKGWDAEKLNEALKSQDSMMKMGAIRALQEAPKDECVNALMDALDDSDRLVRINAAIALGRSKNPLSAISLVHNITYDEDSDVQTYALWAYRQIDQAKVSPKLVTILLESNKEKMIKFAANEIRQKSDLKAIDQLIGRFYSKGFYTTYDLDMKAINALYEIGYMSVEPLVKALDNEDLRVQANAIYTLGKIGDERAVQPLIAHIHKSDLDIRSRISDALIKIGRASVPGSIKLLDDKDREIKWIAAYSLGKIGADAEPALLEALSKKGLEAGEDIIFALGMAGGKDSFDRLYEIYVTTRDDSVRSWATISLANIISSKYLELKDRVVLNKFLKDLGEQFKPHMLLSNESLSSLGRIYATKAVSSADPEAFRSNISTAIKCYDLSIIEKENMIARYARLLYSSYLKLMTSKSPEIMNYIEKDINDFKKDAEKAENKKEIIFILGKILQVLRRAYEDKNFNFVEGFKEYFDLCNTLEQFLVEAGEAMEESKKLSPKELATLHTDVEIIQGKINSLLGAFGKLGDTESASQAYRLSTEMAKLDTGLYDDYRTVEACLKNIVRRMQVADDLKSDLYFKILQIGKAGMTQIELVLDEIIKSLKVELPPAEVTEKALVKPLAKEAKEKRRTGILDYIIIAIIILLIIIVIVLALNKFGYIRLPYTFPVSWLNPALDRVILLGLF